MTVAVAWVRSGVPMWEAWDVEISRAEAIAEIDKHDVEGGSAAFLTEVGDKSIYRGAEVLEWLGY
ncbi:hypothetical protein KZX46_03180 (plasmid) [Polymorphobacter sp. PAMC 29334]|uniref:hypothetical protein n=1 Tax=Polymorphobacter sp. PAMC 29334 TaxID=2862331 RepID=UPI001C740131|nr:hypothetical protein [Polymorphobacter sp. PAMC 29334]QYE33659.1 hypothetical protein KZX46_03180 [Polymorphobacter sp. PAMC 29334]